MKYSLLILLTLVSCVFAEFDTTSLERAVKRSSCLFVVTVEKEYSRRRALELTIPYHHPHKPNDPPEICSTSIDYYDITVDEVLYCDDFRAYDFFDLDTNDYYEMSKLSHMPARYISDSDLRPVLFHVDSLKGSTIRLVNESMVEYYTQILPDGFRIEYGIPTREEIPFAVESVVKKSTYLLLATYDYKYNCFVGVLDFGLLSLTSKPAVLRVLEKEK